MGCFSVCSNIVTKDEQISPVRVQPAAQAATPSGDTGSKPAQPGAARQTNREDSAQMNMDGDDLSEPLAGHPKFVRIKDLKEGASGFVQLAVNKFTQEQVAIKFLERGDKGMKRVEREILNHRLCAAHPNIIQFKEVFLTPRYIGIAMEFAAGRDFAEYLGKHRSASGGRGLPEAEARWFFQQLLVGMEFCHRQNIANRDIKLDNILLDAPYGTGARPHLKLCDFGYSKDALAHSQCATLCGSPDYIAPEVLKQDGQYDGMVADVWSCGVVLYLMLTCRFPFVRPEDKKYNAAVKMQKMFMRIMNGDYLPVADISAGCLDLLARMLTVDPAKRITIPDLLSHPWVLQDFPPHLRTINDQLLRTPLEARLHACQDENEIVTLTQAGVNGRATPTSGVPLPGGYARRPSTEQVR